MQTTCPTCCHYKFFQQKCHDVQFQYIYFRLLFAAVLIKLQPILLQSLFGVSLMSLNCARVPNGVTCMPVVLSIYLFSIFQVYLFILPGFFPLFSPPLWKDAANAAELSVIPLKWEASSLARFREVTVAELLIDRADERKRAREV